MINLSMCHTHRVQHRRMMLSVHYLTFAFNGIGPLHRKYRPCDGQKSEINNFLRVSLHSFVVLQASGQPHAPQFTVVCKLASIQRSGNFSTKKGAKQLAAQAMLNVVQQLPSATDNDKQVAPIASIDAPTPAKVMRTYRELKNSQSLGTDCKHKVFNLSNRHKYFVKLPKEDIQAAVNIIQGCDDSFAVGSSDRDRLDLILKALKIDYVVNDIENHFEQHKALIMLGDYDSVHVGPENELYANVLDYLKIMLDLKMIY